MTRSTYAPHAGPITLDTLDDLLASRRLAFGGFTMKADDDEDEDDDDTEGDPGDDGEDDGDDEDEDDDYVPPTKAEWAKAQAALKKANGQAKRARLKAAAAKPGKHKAAAADGDDEDEDKGEKAAAAEAEKWKPKVVNAAARSALAEAGGRDAARLLRLVDHDALDVDDEGEVDGLDDEVERIKAEFPELFGGRRGRRVETGERKSGASKKTLSATERQAAALRGK